RRLNALQQQWQGNNRRQAQERRPIRLSLRDKIDLPRPTLAADGRRTTVGRLRRKWAVSERREYTMSSAGRQLSLSSGRHDEGSRSGLQRFHPSRGSGILSVTEGPGRA